MSETNGQPEERWRPQNRRSIGALSALIQRPPGGLGGARFARWIAWTTALAFGGGAMWMSAQRAAEGSSPLAQKGGWAIAEIAGIFAAFTYAKPANDPQTDDAIRALAQTHGFSAETVTALEMRATLGQLFRHIFRVLGPPSIALGLLPPLALVLYPPHHLPPPREAIRLALPLASNLVISLAAGALFSVVVAASRGLGKGKRQERRWLLGIIVAPWLAAQLLRLPIWVRYLSVPTLLGSLSDWLQRSAS